MGAADTNVLLRLVLEDDEQQARAARSFLRTNAPLFVSHVVLAELSWVLASGYEFSRDQVRAVIEMLLETDGIEVQERSVVQAALAYHRASHADLPDCLVLAIAARAGATPLGTFDKKLGKLPGARRLGPRS
jgi:predicted nucleic-acid-binding protein